MRPLHAAVLLAVVTVASTATAHSWILASVIGTVKPGTLHCEGQRCMVTIRADRVEALDHDLSRRDAEIDVTFSPVFTLADHDRAKPWTDVQAALLAVGQGHVRLRGELDFLDQRAVLLARRGARVSSDDRSASAPGKLFSACGRPPWSQATLGKCFAAEPRSRRITVHAALATEALAETRSPEAVTALDLDGVSVGDDGYAISSPAPYEIARLRPGATLGRVAADRAALSTLHVGDRLRLEGVYELPGPASVKGAAEPRCNDDHCWPRLLVDHVEVEPKP
jgi:hypothetical protein